MPITQATFAGENDMGEEGLLGPHEGGPGAGSTKAKGNTASLGALPAGNSASTGAQGILTVHPVTGMMIQSTAPTSAPITNGFVL